MRDWKRKSNDPSNTDLVELGRDWIVKTTRQVTHRVHTVVSAWPKATAVVGLAIVVVAFALFRTGKAVGEYREKRHNEWRLQEIDGRLRQADQRVRDQMMSMNQEQSGEFRGVFETMREPTEPPPATELPPVSESKP